MSSFLPLVYVGVGGLAGSVTRYLTTQFMQRFSFEFPYGTLTSNLAGCFLIGVIVGLGMRSDAVSPEARLLLATGFCGGFTTLSSMAYELSELMRDGTFLLAAVYFAATFVGAMLLFVAGSMLAQLVFRGA